MTMIVLASSTRPPNQYRYHELCSMTRRRREKHTSNTKPLDKISVDTPCVYDEPGVGIHSSAQRIEMVV